MPVKLHAEQLTDQGGAAQHLPTGLEKTTFHRPARRTNRATTCPQWWASGGQKVTRSKLYASELSTLESTDSSKLRSASMGRFRDRERVVRAPGVLAPPMVSISQVLRRCEWSVLPTITGATQSS